MKKESELEKVQLGQYGNSSGQSLQNAAMENGRISPALLLLPAGTFIPSGLAC